MQTINLDLSVKAIIPLLHAKQADVGRKFKAILTDGGISYPVPTGAAVSVWYSGSSGEGNYTDVGANSAVSVSGNEIVVEMIAQMLANYGMGTMCIVIHTADGNQLGTWNIPYVVEPLPGMGSTAAQAYFTAFSKAVEDLAYPDASLSSAGKAADAAAVGRALAGKAPAGFGLGGKNEFDMVPVGPANLDDTVAGGWYIYYDSSYKSLAGLTFSGGILVIPKYVGAFQYFFPRDIGSVGTYAVRCTDDYGVWSEWEVANPPMVMGVEYRTTERWNSKPVYTKLINCGALTGYAAINPDIGNALMLRGIAFVLGRGSLPFDFGIDSIYNCRANFDSSIYLYSSGGYDGNTIYAQIWYVY